MMKLKTKIALLFLFISTFCTPLQSVWSYSTITDLDFIKNANGKTEIKIIADGKYEYIVNPANKFLEIDFNNAIFSDELIKKLNGVNAFNSEIDKIFLDNIDNGDSKLRIKLVNPQTFKFVINSRNSLAKLYTLDKKSNFKPIKVKASTNTSKAHIGDSSTTKPAQTDIDTSVTKINSPDNQLSQSNPIPDDELLRRLDNDATPEIPRIVKKNIFTSTKMSDKNNIAEDNNVVSKDVNLFSNSKQLSALPHNKTSQNSTSKKHFSLSNSSTPKIIEVDKLIKQPNSPEPTENKLLYQPRDINSLTLGLFEQIENSYLKPISIHDIPGPKSSITSDGQLAFTVHSSKGSYSAVVNKTNMENISSSNTSQSNNNDTVLKITQSKFRISKDFKLLIIKAREYQNNGDNDQAESFFKKAIEMSPETPWGYIALAEFYNSKNDYNNAIISYNNALKLIPNKVELVYNIAVDFYKLSNLEKAEYYLEKVVDLSPTFTLGYYNLGTLAYKRGDFDISIQYLNKTLELNPVFNDAHYNIALAYLGKNDKQQAISHFKKCLDIDPFDSECSQMYSKFLSKKK